MPRQGFYPGGSTQPNRGFDHDLECRDLHAFGNLVCNGEQRVGGKSIANTSRTCRKKMSPSMAKC